MSLSPNPDGSGFLRQQQGKTPPPAPSAAYARRAREIQAEEGLGTRYRPPPVRAPQGLSLPDGLGGAVSQSSQPSISSASLRQTLTPIDDTSQHSNAFSFPASYRRARAGTLPSNVQLAAANYASTLSTVPGGSSFPSSNENSVASSPITSLPPAHSTPSLLGGTAGNGTTASRPSLRHAASAAPAPSSSIGSANSTLAPVSATSALSGGLGTFSPSPGLPQPTAAPSVTGSGERTSRLRSGSLTLQSGGLGDAFGPSIFSSSWLPGGAAGVNRDPGFGTLDELRSLASGDSQAGEDYDVHTVHTLDYLGLADDGTRRHGNERNATNVNVNGLAGSHHHHHGGQLQSFQSSSNAPRMVEMRDPNSQSGASNRLRANTVANPYRRTAQRTVRLAAEPAHDEDEEYSSGPGGGNEYATPMTTATGLGVPNYSRQRLDSYDGAGTTTSGYVSSSSAGNERAYVVRGIPETTADRLASSARVRASSLGTADEQNVRRRVNIAMGMDIVEESVGNTVPLSAGGAFSQSPYRTGPGATDYNDVTVLSQPQYHLLHQQQQVGQGGTTGSGNALLRQLHVDTSQPSQQQGHRSAGLSSPSVRFPSSGDLSTTRTSPGSVGQLNVHSGHREGRAVSPKESAGVGQQSQAQGASGGQGQAQIQTPSRSLWIGNLDSSVSGEDLARAFAPYGAIESFRLLPEKECGFINFVDITDAIRAKDDVLNRLGGSIGQANGQTVRIGFGKADSAPATPSGPNSGGTHSSHFLANSNPSLSARDGVSRSSSGDGGMDAQLQSTPTRALWIGSIPSTTTPATILSVFSPFGPIESARVLTHKNCGFVNFERLDDAVRARKALNGRDVLGSDVGAIRIGFARVPVKNGAAGVEGEENTSTGIQGIGDLSVGATIHALRGIKGASSVAADQQVLGGAVENYRSNLLLSMLRSIGNASYGGASVAPVTEQQMIMRMLGDGSAECEADLAPLADFRPPMAYYTTIPVAAERTNPRRWDASKLRELRKRLDSGSCTIEEIDDVASDFLDGEIVDLASDWLGNTVVQKLFEKCSPGPRIAMLERVAPHLAMIGIHKNGTWAAQKVIECASTPEEIALIAINLRPYTPPLLLDQFGNYVVQCCLRFGSPANEFIFEAMTDRLWEIAQGRFGARSMRACLESPYITIHQQRRIATAVILNSIPLATNPNGALLLTWLLDTSGFHNRYSLLAPRFTPHLSHLCTHKLASVTVLRIVNQKSEPEASRQIVQALFFSPNDHVLSDVLGDQINGVAVVHKILQSSFLDPAQRPSFLEATKRVLIDLKVTTAQAYRRLIEEVGLPIPSFANAPTSFGAAPVTGNGATKKPSLTGMNVHHGGYGTAPTSQVITPQQPFSADPSDPSLQSVMASLHILELQQQASRLAPNRYGPLPTSPAYAAAPIAPQTTISPATFSPSSDPFLPLSLRGEYGEVPPVGQQRMPYGHRPSTNSVHLNGSADSYESQIYGTQANGSSGSNLLSPPSNGIISGSMGQIPSSPYGVAPPMPPHVSPGNPYHNVDADSEISEQIYQAYMYQLYQQQQQQSPNSGFR